MQENEVRGRREIRLPRREEKVEWNTLRSPRTARSLPAPRPPIQRNSEACLFPILRICQVCHHYHPGSNHHHLWSELLHSLPAGLHAPYEDSFHKAVYSQRDHCKTQTRSWDPPPLILPLGQGISSAWNALPSRLCFLTPTLASDINFPFQPQKCFSWPPAHKSPYYTLVLHFPFVTLQIVILHLCLWCLFN